MYILFKQHFFETSGNKANYQKVTPHSNIQVGWIRINLFVSLHGIEFWLLDFAQTVPFIFSWRCWLPFMRISCPLFIKNILSRPANHWNIFEAVRYYQIYQSLEIIIHSLWHPYDIFYFSRFSQSRDLPRCLLQVFPNRRWSVLISTTYV